MELDCAEDVAGNGAGAVSVNAPASSTAVPTAADKGAGGSSSGGRVGRNSGTSSCRSRSGSRTGPTSATSRSGSVASCRTSLAQGSAMLVREAPNGGDAGLPRNCKAQASTPTASQLKESSVRVVVRFRPPYQPDRGGEEEARLFFLWQDGRTIESFDQAHIFEFDQTFGETCSQRAVYEEVGQPIVEDFLDGYNGTVLAYGQTGSGKTYSMFGPCSGLAMRELRAVDPESPGIVQRVASHVFGRIQSGASDSEFVLRCSLFEVYREQLRDLLEPSNISLKVKETPQQGIYVDGLVHEFVSCEADVTQLLRVGRRMRAVAATQFNQHSSRSHVIFSMTSEQRRADGTERVGKLHLVDLAGSEKVWKSSSSGIILEEAKKINWSLSALGNVINALAERRTHVPYRDSKLTRILQETLGGNFKTVLLTTCSPMQAHFDETLSSLHFASRAKTICNHVKVNFVYSAERMMVLVNRLRHELLLTRLEIARHTGRLCRSVPEQAAQQGGTEARPAQNLQWDASLLEALTTLDSEAGSPPQVRQRIPTAWQDVDGKGGPLQCESKETWVRDAESLEAAKSAVQAAHSRMEQAIADMDEWRLAVQEDDGAAAEASKWELQLKYQILQKQLKSWELHGQTEALWLRQLMGNKERELLRSHCKVLKTLIDDAKRELRNLVECDHDFDCPAETVADAPVTARGRYFFDVDRSASAADIEGNSTTSSPEFRCESFRLLQGPSAFGPDTACGSSFSLAALPTAAFVAYATPGCSAQEGAAVFDEDAGGGAGGDQTSLRAKLQHTLDMLRVDIGRDEDTWNRRFAKQKENMQQLLVAEERRRQLLDRAQAESAREEQRLEALLQHRRAALEAARVRARKSRALCVAEKAQFEALARLVQAGDSGTDVGFGGASGSDCATAGIAGAAGFGRCCEAIGQLGDTAATPRHGERETTCFPSAGSGEAPAWMREAVEQVGRAMAALEHSKSASRSGADAAIAHIGDSATRPHAAMPFSKLGGG
mmetsp:Transcript_19728/g.54249  ORF Transcript_19728/g.54249 Transcript_19728/m.54249 type:complete len:1005 (+) Transcript_19728:69-3083(+)